MVNMVPISEAALINPRLPKELRANTGKQVSFLPMAAVKEDGQVEGVEPRMLADVVKGYTYFERGDILFAKITPCFENGKATYLDSLPLDVGFGSTEFHVLRPNKGVHGRYLFHMVWNPVFRYLAAKAMTGAAGQKRVPTAFVKQFEIPLPKQDEQKRIAAILDKADAIRRKRQEAIDLADTFLRSVFLKMFGDPVTNPMGWDEAPLKDIAFIGSGVTKGKKYKDVELIEVPYMRVANVQDGWIDTSDMKTISVSTVDVERYSLQKGDLLLTEGGDPDKLGRGAVWDGSISPCIHQNHIFKVRFDASVIIPEYASFLIGSTRGKTYFLRAAKQTTGIATINKTQLSKFVMLVPDIGLQEEFLKIVKELSGIKNKLERALFDSNTLFTSLQQRAFQGNL